MKSLFIKTTLPLLLTASIVSPLSVQQQQNRLSMEERAYFDLLPSYEADVYPMVFLTFSDNDPYWADEMNNRIPLYLNKNGTVNYEFSLEMFNRNNLLIQDRPETLYFNFYESNETEEDDKKMYAISSDINWDHSRPWDASYYSDSYIPTTQIDWRDEVALFDNEPLQYNTISDGSDGFRNEYPNKNWLVASTTPEPLDGSWIANRVQFFYYLPYDKFIYLKIDESIGRRTESDEYGNWIYGSKESMIEEFKNSKRDRVIDKLVEDPSVEWLSLNNNDLISPDPNSNYLSTIFMPFGTWGDDDWNHYVEYNDLGQTLEMYSEDGQVVTQQWLTMSGYAPTVEDTIATYRRIDGSEEWELIPSEVDPIENQEIQPPQTNETKYVIYIAISLVFLTIGAAIIYFYTKKH